MKITPSKTPQTAPPPPGDLIDDAAVRSTETAEKEEYDASVSHFTTARLLGELDPGVGNELNRSGRNPFWSRYCLWPRKAYDSSQGQGIEDRCSFAPFVESALVALLFAGSKSSQGADNCSSRMDVALCVRLFFAFSHKSVESHYDRYWPRLEAVMQCRVSLQKENQTSSRPMNFKIHEVVACEVHPRARSNIPSLIRDFTAPRSQGVALPNPSYYTYNPIPIPNAPKVPRYVSMTGEEGVVLVAPYFIGGATTRRASSSLANVLVLWSTRASNIYDHITYRHMKKLAHDVQESLPPYSDYTARWEAENMREESEESIGDLFGDPVDPNAPKPPPASPVKILKTGEDEEGIVIGPNQPTDLHRDLGIAAAEKEEEEEEEEEEECGGEKEEKSKDDDALFRLHLALRKQLAHTRIIESCQADDDDDDDMSML